MLECCIGDTSRQFSWSYTPRSQELTALFSLSAFGDYFCDAQYRIEREGRDDFLLLYTLEGEGVLRYGQTEERLLPEMIALIDCRQYHLYRTAGQEGWHFLWMHFSAAYAADKVTFINGTGLFVPRLPKSYFVPCFHTLQTLVDSVSVSAQAEIELLLHTLLVKLLSLRTADNNRRFLHLQPQIEEVVRFLQQHYADTVTLEQLADMARMSKYYFIKAFKELTGTTPYQFLLVLRVDAVKRLLRQTELSVNEIAEQTGFCDGKNCILHFKKLTGVTPLQFRLHNPL